jgi:hypothetical protein
MYMFVTELVAVINVLLFNLIFFDEKQRKPLLPLINRYFYALTTQGQLLAMLHLLLVARVLRPLLLKR